MKIDLIEVEKAGLTLEETMVLVEIEYIRNKKKLPYQTDKSLYVKLVEEGYLSVTPDGYRITVVGYELFRAVTGKKLLGIKAPQGNFAEFWSAFPPSDRHGDWRRTRSLKDDKSTSNTLYNKIIKNKEATHAQILEALAYEIKDRKENSITENRLTFMKNSKTWLRTKQFLITMEEMEDDDNETPDNWQETLV